MNTYSSVPGPSNFAHELQSLRDQWCWFLALGIAMVVFGTIAIGSACIATMATTWLFGFLLLAGGISEIVSSFWAGRWSGTLTHLLIGILYAVVGLMIIDHPENAAIQLTLIIAMFLVFSGIFRIVFALSERFTLSWYRSMRVGVMWVPGRRCTRPRSTTPREMSCEAM